MPELPEVETVCRGLAPHLEGKKISAVSLHRSDLRIPFPPDFVKNLIGRKIVAISRRAKYLLVSLDNGATWLSHLGMSGRFTIFHESGEDENLGTFYDAQPATTSIRGAHDHFEMWLDDSTHLVYTDPRRFGLMDLIKPGGQSDHKFLKNLGAEPLGNELSGHFLAQKFKTRRCPLKSILLDQKVLAGLGNIYVCEALFLAGLSPLRSASSLVKAKSIDKRLDKLTTAIRATLEKAIIAGGTTLRNYADVNGATGAYQLTFNVYDRENKPCPSSGCGAKIKRIAQSGRSTFYCPRCQK